MAQATGRTVHELLYGEPSRALEIKRVGILRRRWDITIPGRAGISTREIQEWAAFEQIEGPLSGIRGDFHAAQLSQLLIALNLKKGKKPPKLDELMLEWDQAAPQGASTADLLDKIRQANDLLGGSDTRGGKL